MISYDPAGVGSSGYCDHRRSSFESVPCTLLERTGYTFGDDEELTTQLELIVKNMLQFAKADGPFFRIFYTIKSQFNRGRSLSVPYQISEGTLTHSHFRAE